MLNFTLVCLAKVFDLVLLGITNVMENPLLTVRVILWRWSVKTLLV